MFHAFIHWVVRILKIFSGIMLVVMMLLTCADVVGNIFGFPIMGSEEIVSLSAALLLAFALPAAHRDKAHIGVDLLYLKFPPRLKKMNNIFLSVISVIFFFLVAKECYLYGLELKSYGRVSGVLELPFYYILYAIAFACLILTIVIIFEFFQRITGGQDD